MPQRDSCLLACVTGSTIRLCATIPSASCMVALLPLICPLIAFTPLPLHPSYATPAAQQDEDAEAEEAVIVIDEDPETHES